jgi:hypothetical protein
LARGARKFVHTSSISVYGFQAGPLTNNTVLITGAASGIGRSLCHRLSEQGASLALIDHDGGAQDTLARELEMAQVRFRIAVADVRDRPGLVQAVDTLVRELGPIDILVGRAGVCGISLVDDLKVEQVTVFPGFVHTPLLGAVMVSTGIRRLFGSIATATATAKITQAILQRRRVCYFPRTMTLLAYAARLLPAAALDWIRDRIAGMIPVANARRPLRWELITEPGSDDARTTWDAFLS